MQKVRGLFFSLDSQPRTGQGRAGVASGTCCFPKAFQGCLQKSFHLSLSSLQKMSGKNLYPFRYFRLDGDFKGMRYYFSLSHFCPTCESRLRNAQISVFQTAVLPVSVAFLCQALSSCPAWLGMVQLQALSWWLCCSARPEQGRGESGVLNTLKTLEQSFSAVAGAWFVQDQQSQTSESALCRWGLALVCFSPEISWFRSQSEAKPA